MKLCALAGEFQKRIDLLIEIMEELSQVDVDDKGRSQCPFCVWGLMVWLLNVYRGLLNVYLTVNVWSTEI